MSIFRYLCYYVEFQGMITVMNIDACLFHLIRIMISCLIFSWTPALRSSCLMLVDVDTTTFTSPGTLSGDWPEGVSIDCVSAWVASKNLKDNVHRQKDSLETFKTIWVFPKIMVSPNSSVFNRVFHYKPSILGVFPLFLETSIYLTPFRGTKNVSSASMFRMFFSRLT